MAPTQETPTRDGTISGWATPGIPGGAMAVIDAAHDIGGMPPLIREEDAGVASPSAYPLLEEGPLTPRAASPGFRFLISSCSTTVSHGSCPWKLFLDRDTCQSRDPNLAPQADRVLLSDTFYLSPSVSRSSDFFSLRSSDSGTETHDVRSIMPGQIFDAPTEHRFPSSTTSGYFALTDDAADPRFNGTTQRPPCSAESGKSDRTASPLNFARWAKRQHHTHNQDRHEEEQVHKSKKGNHRAEDRKLSKGSSKRNVLSRSSSIQKRQAQAAVPQMTREEFEALPLAIQRKYFSTLERLRFAQDAGLVEGISQHYDDISNFKRRNPRRDRSPSEDVVGRSRRGSVAELHSSASDSPPLCAGLQEATREEKPCREDKARPAMRHRASVILDAADEAVYKFNKQANRRNTSTTNVGVLTPPLSPSRHSMDSQDSFRKDVHQSADGHVPRSFFESFRWLEEEEDLDLRLFLDDYHANLREGTPTTKQRPSFRRRISISKIPFGRRNSVSSADPVAKEAVAPTKSPPIRSSGSDGPSHARRKSRALSLIAPKHVSQPPVAAIDPSAAHYQDPEARLKLRVYLASPQKFDEAVEFGFPSTDVLSAASPFNADGGGLSGQTKQRVADASLDMQTFLADQDEDEEDIDNVSLYSDHASVADPDSPKTPEPFEHRTTGPRHARFASATLLSGRDIGRKTPEGAFYAQAPATSREMTLRMTLTRPDLRAHEDEMYGWQQQKHVYQQHARRPTALASLAAENRVAYNGHGAYNSLEKFPEVDHWNGTTTEKGVIRRIWNRVRRG